MFYTILPLPQWWPLEFSRIARWAPWIGLLLGGILAGLNGLLLLSPLSPMVRGVLVTAVWIFLTGGLHLDGVMDTADGLAVLDPEKRLQVMSDSRTGAFGVMAAIILVLLKVGAIADLSTPQYAGLIFAPIWGRWAQVLAIARYPYLKAEGKGAFHRNHFKGIQDIWPSILLLGVVSLIPAASPPHSGEISLWSLCSGLSLAWGVGAWFNRQLQGMTGDSYGAIVEWTEALFLCCFGLLTK